MAEQELIKPIIKVGNSAGVILPIEWLKGKAKIILLEKPINPSQEIFEILQEDMPNITSIALVGSYARGEENSDSDIDVLVITNGLDKKINLGRYEIILISEDNLKKELEKNALPLLPMLLEAKPLLNKELIAKYTKTKINGKNLKWHIETTKSALEVIKKSLELAEKEKNVSDNVIYSIILRLREIYLVDCIIHNKKASNKRLLELIYKLANSYEPYNSYIRAKAKSSSKKVIKVEQAINLYDYIKDSIDKQEKWIKKTD